MTISQKRLKELFTYNAQTGHLYWRVSNSNAIKVGQRAGHKRPDGYVVVYADGISYREHRLIWLWHTGSFPKNFIDHKNGIRDFNKIENLREATKSQNSQNAARQRNNTSGYTGVVWNARQERWIARVKVNGEVHHFGTHATPEDAHAAYLAGKARLHSFQPKPRYL